MIAQFVQFLLQPIAVFQHLVRPRQHALAFRRQAFEPLATLDDPNIHLLFQLLDAC